MKSLHKQSQLFILIILLSSINAYSQEYPQYGSEEWKQLSREDQRKSLQIPAERLKAMSTTDLIQAYINFPLTPLIDAYNNRQKGFERIYNEFNGLRELIQRGDAGTCLIDYYKQLKPDRYDESWDLVAKGRFSARITYIELLISQDEIINKLKENEVKILLGELLQKMDIKNKHFSLHSGYGLEATAYSMTKLIFLRGRSNGLSQRITDVPGVKNFIAGNRISFKRIPNIITIANDFITK